MLGPELVNHVIKPTPLFSTGTPSLQLTHPVPRELGLSNYQTINTPKHIIKSMFYFTEEVTSN